MISILDYESRILGWNQFFKTRFLKDTFQFYLLTNIDPLKGLRCGKV